MSLSDRWFSQGRKARSEGKGSVPWRRGCCSKFYSWMQRRKKYRTQVRANTADLTMLPEQVQVLVFVREERQSWSVSPRLSPKSHLSPDLLPSPSCSPKDKTFLTGISHNLPVSLESSISPSTELLSAGGCCGVYRNEGKPLQRERALSYPESFNKQETEPRQFLCSQR